MNCADCLHFKVCEEHGLYFEDEYIKNVAFSENIKDLCSQFKNKADFVEIPCRCKDCVLHEKGCPLDTHPYMTPDDGYCYQGGRK